MKSRTVIPILQAVAVALMVFFGLLIIGLYFDLRGPVVWMAYAALVSGLAGFISYFAVPSIWRVFSSRRN